MRENPELKLGLTLIPKMELTSERLTLNKRDAGSHSTEEKVIYRLSQETHLMPGIPKIVAVGVSHCNKCLYSVDIFLLHLCDAGAGCQQGEASKSLNVGISFQL